VPFIQQATTLCPQRMTRAVTAGALRESIR
jgi:hypothetical protein